MTTEHELLKKIVPTHLKEAIAKGEHIKIARVVTGLDNFELKDVAQYFGEKIAARHNTWRPVASGLLALKALSKDG